MNPFRRQFTSSALGSLVAYGLIETLWSRDLFAEPVKPTIEAWLKDLVEMTKELKGKKLTDLQFQTKMEDLYRKVDLAALIGLVKLDDIEKKVKLPENGASNSAIDLAKVEGLPANVGFGRQIFGCKKGRSIVPHGHSNMCTGFIILKGQWEGQALRPRRNREGTLRHQADDQPRVQARRTLHHLGPQGQHPLVQVARPTRRSSSTSTSSATTRRSRTTPGGCTSTRTARSSPAG